MDQADQLLLLLQMSLCRGWVGGVCGWGGVCGSSEAGGSDSDLDGHDSDLDGHGDQLLRDLLL